MANVNSIASSGSAASSLYGNRNVLSGLASGLDTEAMIENSVSGYKEKIKQLNQDQAKIEWKQDAVREIIDQSVNLVNKYSSFSSSTNLMSASFFSNASATTVSGQYADKVSATGSSSNNVEITQIAQMATASTYTFSPGASWGSAANNATGSISLNSAPQVNNNAGVVTLNYGDDGNGGQKSIQFEIGDFEKSSNASELRDLIQSKLRGLTVKNAKGETVQATEYFQLSVENNSLSIKAKDYEQNSNDEWTESIQSVIPSLTHSDANGNNSTFNAAGGMGAASQTAAQYLQGKSITVTYNGLDQKITFPHEPVPPFNTLDKMAQYIEDQINQAFSTAMNGEGGTTVTDEEGNTSIKYITVSASADGKLGFNFLDTSGANSLQINSDFNSVLGLDKKGLNTQVDVANTKLGDTGVDASEPLTINGVTISTNFTANSTIQDVLNAINNNSGKTGVSVSYSKVSSQFVFTSTETGSAHDIQLGDGLAKQLFGGGTATTGKDAIVKVKNNGVEQTLYRSSNTIEMDGLKVTLKGTFSAGANETGITFGTSSNSDKIVNAVRSFVEDFNKLSTSIRTAYGTQPNRKSDGSAYEPLTEEDRSSMSEYAVKNYEETAKQGLLFADSDLSSMYSKMIRQLIPDGATRQEMAEIGLTTSFDKEKGVTTLTLDESKLRAALEGGTDSVRKVFNDSSYGVNDGLVGRMKKTLDTYTSTSFSKPGILVRKAGTKLSSVSLLDNLMQKQIDRVQQQIEKWQIKMSSKVDYYTKQFSKLEQLMNTMNNQSSMISGMMGG